MSGSTNFLPWDGSQTNIEDDATYLADPLRVDGAPVNSIFPSNLANKALYQACGLAAAFASSLALKGYTATDTDLVALRNTLDNVLTAVDRPAALRNNSEIIDTGNTAQNTIYTLTVPGGAMSTQGILRFVVRFQVAINGHTKPEVSVFFGGSLIGNIDLQSGGGGTGLTGGTILEGYIYNRSASNSQGYDIEARCGSGAVIVATGSASLAVNTATDQNFVVKNTNSDAAQSVVFTHCLVELL